MKTIIISLILAISTIASSQTKGKVENVDAASFKKMIDEKKGYLIDLRTTEELQKKGMIKGAVQVDFLGKDAESVILKLDPKKTYLIYCAGGGRSGDCADLMHKNGFEHIINLDKGFDDWKRKGFETEFPK